MARIENTSTRQYDVSALPKLDKDGRPIAGPVFVIPRSNTGEDGKVNGVGEIPDDVLAELLAKDVWTKSLFECGDLIAPAKAAPAKQSEPAKK